MTDPNLDLGLDYTGGINKPNASQLGNLARVDSSGLNLEYVPDFVRQQVLTGVLTDVGALRFTTRDITTGAQTLEVWAHDGVALRKLSSLTSQRLVTANATATTAFAIAIAASTTLSCVARWKGRDVAGNEALRESRFVVRRVASAAPAQWGSTVDNFASTKDDGTWGTPGFVFVSNTLALQVTGKAATSITWDVELTWREMP